MIPVQLRAPLKIPSANRNQLNQTVKHWVTFGPHFSESFAKSQLQSPDYAPSIWLVFEKMSHRASRNEFLEVPLKEEIQTACAENRDQVISVKRGGHCFGFSMENKSENWHDEPDIQSVSMRPAQGDGNPGGITMPD